MTIGSSSGLSRFPPQPLPTSRWNLINWIIKYKLQQHINISIKLKSFSPTEIHFEISSALRRLFYFRSRCAKRLDVISVVNIVKDSKSRSAKVCKIKTNNDTLCMSESNILCYVAYFPYMDQLPILGYEFFSMKISVQTEKVLLWFNWVIATLWSLQQVILSYSNTGG